MPQPVYLRCKPKQRSFDLLELPQQHYDRFAGGCRSAGRERSALRHLVNLLLEWSHVRLSLGHKVAGPATRTLFA
jgi:hypothetical protein